MSVSCGLYVGGMRIIQFNDVRMVEQLKIFNFVFDMVLYVVVDKFFVRDDFEGNLLVGVVVDSQFDFVEGVFVECFDNVVGVDVLFGVYFVVYG